MTLSYMNKASSIKSLVIEIKASISPRNPEIKASIQE